MARQPSEILEHVKRVALKAAKAERRSPVPAAPAVISRVKSPEAPSQLVLLQEYLAALQAAQRASEERASLLALNLVSLERAVRTLKNQLQAAVWQRGERGEQGPRGERGEQGPQGEKGEKGETGERGPTGLVGAHWIAEGGQQGRLPERVTCPGCTMEYDLTLALGRDFTRVQQADVRCQGCGSGFSIDARGVQRRP